MLVIIFNGYTIFLSGNWNVSWILVTFRYLILIYFVDFWQTTNFIVAYITIVIFAVICKYILHRGRRNTLMWTFSACRRFLEIIQKGTILLSSTKYPNKPDFFLLQTKFVRLDDMDFETGRRELDEISEEQEG